MNEGQILYLIIIQFKAKIYCIILYYIYAIGETF